jgi:hypothetical protein
MPATDRLSRQPDPLLTDAIAARFWRAFKRAREALR